jgi:hypothetical protein
MLREWTDGHRMRHAARVYIGMGLPPIPIPYMKKKATLPDWQLLRMKVEDISTYFNGAPQNIGVILGNGPADVDLDCREASIGAPYLLPATRRFGHGNSPFSHWIYHAPGLSEMETKATREFKSIDGEMLLELRSGGGGRGAQTVFPPSVHESGEKITWADRRTIAVVDPADLILRCKLLAVACVLGRGFPRGGRHNLCFDIGGFLSRCCVPEELIRATVEAVGRISGQDLDFPEMRRSAIDGSMVAHRAGFPTMAEAFGEDTAKRIADWLEYPKGNGADGSARRDSRYTDFGADPRPEDKPVTLLAFNPADWEGKQAPERRWDVPDYIPHGVPSLLYADGGTGKGYLGLQLALGRALGKEWIGLMPETGRTLVLSTEDDLDEMWRRIEGMLPFYDARMADLEDIRLVDLVGENSVLGLLQKGIIEPTPMYHALDDYLTDFKPGMVILDVLADLFSGEENNRPQVTQFMGLLKRLGRKHDCTPFLSAQPSLTGMNTGTGTSGSTGWNNSGRARMYFQKVRNDDGDEPNKDLRTFEGMKNNYGVRGGKFDLEWKDGLFRRVSGPIGFERMVRDQKLDETFLSLLKHLTSQNRPVRATNSKSGAPFLFEDEPGNGGFKAKDFGAAMLRLLENGKIANEPETNVPPSKRINRLVIKEGT